MANPDLFCLLFPGLFGWELSAIVPVINSLSRYYKVECMEVVANGKIDLSALRRAGTIWVLSKNWHQAYEVLNKLKQKRIFLSVLGFAGLQSALPALLVRKIRPLVPSDLKVLAHSALTFRFFQEIERIENNQLFFAHFPVPESIPSAEFLFERKEGTYHVGSLSPFVRESNLNYLLGVAHYVYQRDRSVHFHLIGQGPLKNHLSGIIKELNIESNVSIVDSSAEQNLRALDLLLYVPLRNDHFIPLLQAGVFDLPVLASEVPGVEDFIVDGKNGFVVPVNEIRPMGELIGRFRTDQSLGKMMGKKLGEHLRERFSVKELASLFERLFFETDTESSGLTAA